MATRKRRKKYKDIGPESDRTYHYIESEDMDSGWEKDLYANPIKTVTDQLKSLNKTFDLKFLAKKLDLTHTSIEGLGSKIKSYQEEIFKKQIKNIGSEFKVLSDAIDKKILQSKGIIGSVRKEKIAESTFNIKEALTSYGKEPTEKNFKKFTSSITNLESNIKELVRYGGEGGKKSTLKSIRDFSKTITDYGAGTEKAMQDVDIFGERLKTVNETLTEISTDTLDTFKTSLESIPLIGTILERFGFTEKLTDKLKSSVGRAIEKTLLKAIGTGKVGGIMGMGGMLPIAGMTVGIAALAFLIKKLVDEFQDFREAVKSTADAFKITTFSAIKFAMVAEKVRLGTAGKLMMMGEKPLKASEVATLQAAAAGALRTEEIALNNKVIEQLGIIYRRYKLTSDEIGSLLKVMEQLGKSSDKSLSNMVVEMSKVEIVANKFDITMGSLISSMQNATKVAAIFGAEGSDAFYNVAAQAAKYGMNLDSIAETMDGMFDIQNSIERFVTAKRQFARLGLPGMDQILDYNKWMQAALTDNFDEMFQMVSRMSEQVLDQHDRWRSSDPFRAKMLRLAMAQFGFPIEELREIRAGAARQKAAEPKIKELKEKTAIEQLLEESYKGKMKIGLGLEKTIFATTEQRWLQNLIAHPNLQGVPSEIRAKIERRVSNLPRETQKGIIEDVMKSLKKETQLTTTISDANVETLATAIGDSVIAGMEKVQMSLKIAGIEIPLAKVIMKQAGISG